MTSWPTRAASWSGSELVERGRLLGLGIARARGAVGGRARPVPIDHGAVEGPLAATFRVVDLSALWAGPLCARLLGRAGARITKVESVERPDAARADQAFYSWLHDDDEEVVLDSSQRREGSGSVGCSRAPT